MSLSTVLADESDATYATTTLSGGSPAGIGTIDVTEGGLTAAGTSLAVILPSGGAATDVYVVIIAKGSVACTINALTDWSEVLDENLANGLAILHYTGTGVPTDPTFTQSVASRSVWCAYRIPGADRAIAPEVGTTASGTSNVPNPPSRAITGGPKDALAIACFAAATELADNDTLVTTFPTNYTDGQVEKTGGIGGNNLGGLLGAAARQLTGASSEDPGTFTQNASRAWRAQTIVVHPAAAVPSSSGVMRLSLSPGGDPGSDTGHKIRLRARKVSGTGIVTITGAIYEGANNRSGDIESVALTTSFTEIDLTIPSGNAANITSYSDLAADVSAASVTGDNVAVEISWLGLLTPGVSGTAHDPGTIADNFSLSDSVTVSIGRLVTVDDPLDLSEGFNTVTAYQRQVSDPMALSDAATPSVGVFKQQDDPLALADQATPSHGHGRQQDDPFALADQTTPLILVLQPVDDTFALADAVQTAMAFNRQQDDPLGLADQATPVSGHVRQQDDPLALADQATLASGHFRQTDDPFALADQVTALVILLQQINDPFGLADAVQLARSVAIEQNDPLALADQSTMAKGYGLQQNDPLTLADAIATAAATARAIADPLALDDAVQTALGYARAVADPLTFSDLATPELLAGKFVQVDDSLGLADALNMTRTVQIAVADPLALSDQTAIERTVGLVIPDTLVLADQLTIARAVGLALADQLPLADLIKVLGALGVPARFLLTAADRRIFTLSAATKPGTLTLTADQAAPFRLTMWP